MSSCTFFGHRNTPETIRPILEKTIRALIENHNVKTFYVGHQGVFDSMVTQVLRNLKSQYPCIRFYIVLAYRPVHKSTLSTTEETLYPFGLEAVSPRYAILKRNEWMINQADFVIIYIDHTPSNTSKMKCLSEKKKKHVICLSDDV